MQRAESQSVIEERMRWIEAQRREGVEGVYRAQALALPLPPSFHDALRVPRGPRAVIAHLEGPGAAPSGDIAACVRRLEDAGVSALSISTDVVGHVGAFSDVLAAAQACCLPILANDLIVDPLQITMARAHGASAVLLCASVVSDGAFRGLYRHALEVGLDVVAVVRSVTELELVQRARVGNGDGVGIRMVCVSPADPLTGERDPELPERLAATLPEHVVRLVDVCGLSVDAIVACEALGYEAFLCGHRVDLPCGEGGEIRGMVGR